MVVIGTVFDGQYRVERTLGKGAMGIVYEGLHVQSGRRVAIKVIHSSLRVTDSTALQRFQREAHAATAVAAPNIVEVLDCAVTSASDCPYLVMELLRGEDLGALVKRVGPISPHVALRLIAQASVGLRAAHAAGVIHRDIKPENLFLAEGDAGEITLKILDFGVAKIKPTAAPPAAAHALTSTGTLLGSPRYVSPEQARGAKDVDHRTEIWSLGVVLYELLCGHSPFYQAGSLVELMMSIHAGPLPPLHGEAPWVAAPIVDIVDRALCREPSARFQSATALLAAITPLIGDRLLVTRAELVGLSAGERAARVPDKAYAGHAQGGGAAQASRGRESLWTRKASIAAAVILIGVGAIWLARARSADPAATAASAQQPGAPAGKIVLLTKNFSGYRAFHEAPFLAAMKRAGIDYHEEIVPSTADMAKQLGTAGAHFMTITLDQFMLHAPPGKIVAILDVTMGSDAVVLNSRQFPKLRSLEALEGAVQKARVSGKRLRVAFSGSTTSEFMALLLDAQFNQFNLEDFEIVRTREPSEVWAELERPGSTTTVGVLWDPFVSLARRNGYFIALSSRDVPEAIVDVLVASDAIIAERPEVVGAIVNAFYRRVEAGIVDPSGLIARLADDEHILPEDAKMVLDGLAFFTAPKARAWFEGGKLEQRIAATAAILALAGRIDAPPRDVRALFRPAFTRDAAEVTGALIASVRAERPRLAARLEGEDVQVSSEPMKPAEIASAEVIGALCALAFLPGSDALTPDAQRELDAAIPKINDFNLVTVGISIRASRPARVAAVAEYLRKHGVRHRVDAVKGIGAKSTDETVVTLMRLTR
jgi:Protein kinase domain